MPKEKTIATSIVAERMHKPGWKDPRLLIGLLLIVLSVVAVVGVVNATNKTTTYLVAAHDIAVGDPVTTDDFKTLEVRLGDSEQFYLPEGTSIPEKARAQQRFKGGELVTADALHVEDTDGRREATVVLDSTVATSFSEGDYVDIWVSKKVENGTSYSDPTTIMKSAEISHIRSEESMIGSTGKSAVQLLVTDAALADVLAATNNESKINLVPAVTGQK